MELCACSLCEDDDESVGATFSQGTLRRRQNDEAVGVCDGLANVRRV